MTLIKTSILSAIATIIKILNGFVIVKIIAIYVGPSGLALISQFQNFITVLMTFGTGAINTGVIKYTAEYRDEIKEKKKLWSTALHISLIGTLISAVLLILFHNQFSLLLLKDEKYGLIFIVFALTLIFYTLNSLLLAILNGQKEIKKLIIINIISSFIGLFLTGALAYFYGLYGALLSYVLGQSVVFLVTIAFVFKNNWFNLQMFVGKIDKEYLKRLGKYASMAVVAVLTATATKMLIRDYLGESISWNDAGYWDGVSRISDVYLMLIITTLSIYYLPRLSEIKEDSELRKEIFSAYKIILPLVIILAIAVYLLRDIAITLLFTEEFMPMRDLFAYQLFGDVLKIASWLLSYLMVARAMTKIFIYTEIFSAVSYIILSVIFIKYFGLIGVTMAFALNYFLYLIIIVIIFQDLIWEKKEV